MGFDNILCDFYSCPRAKKCQRHNLYKQALKDKFPQVTTFLWECFPNNCEYYIESAKDNAASERINTNNKTRI